MTGLAGVGALVRLALRRDRVLLPSWIAVLALVAISSAAATGDLYPTAASVVRAVGAVNDTPAMVALYGRVPDVGSLGALAMLKPLATGALAVAVLAIVLVVRHTRAEEDAGRLELVQAGAVGRFAPLTAALVVVVGANAVLGAVTAVGLGAVGLPVAGSVAVALAWFAVALVFAAVAGVTAQLVTGARAATGLAVALLGAAFGVRAVGDTAAPWLSWASPLAWAQQVRPYAGDRWWVGGLAVLTAAVVSTAAYALVARRDLGGGLLPDRAGPARAGRDLRSTTGLAWRLHRGPLLAWAAGFAAYGLVVGGVAADVGGMLTSDQARQLFAELGGQGELTDTVLAAMLGILGVVASVYGVQATLRAAAEENTGRAALLLSAPVGRLRWAAGHLAAACAGVVVVLVSAGLAAGAVHAVRTGDAGQVGRVVLGAVVQAPAGWVLAGIVLAVYGAAPRLAAAGWGAVVVFVLLGELGPLLGLPGWLSDLSPYAHVPHLPGGQFSAWPVAALAAVAAVAAFGGLLALRGRDLG
ncbi:ABC transporter permease [Actinokineospora terrae]|uniref:ABC-2 type transport system permease protein n=1 Tax=Actinokineospora terrae TaxID=155974 RepID=A0A1H9X1S3_9PSEU|nr:ABC transporter permease [Actinokineospora terrae]SES40158.1 ABC-2 type transport system permease protein [Actinokineospora terrae]